MPKQKKYELISVMDKILRAENDLYPVHLVNNIHADLGETMETVTLKIEEDSMLLSEDYTQNHKAVINVDTFSEHSYALQPEGLSHERKTLKEVYLCEVVTNGKIDEQVIEGLDPIKNEEAPFACRFCYEEFFCEQKYGDHMSLHMRQLWEDSVPKLDLGIAEHPVSHSVSSSHKKIKQSDLEECDQVLAYPLHGGLVTNLENKPDDKIKELDILALDNHNTIKDGLRNPHIPLLESNELVVGNNTNFNTKQRTHTGEKTFICNFCDQIYARKCELMNHMRKHICQNPSHVYKSRDKNGVKHTSIQARSDIKRFSCELCNYQCNFNSILVNHMRTHTGEKPFICNVCNHKFTENSNLVKHMRIHTGKKPFVCKVCNGKFPLKLYLQNHILRNHTDDKPFACEFCQYKSNDKSTLLRHMKCHTGIKNYCCKYCNYKGATNHRLVLHMRTHTGEKPFACKKCEHKFVQNSDLAKHIMRKHIDVSDDYAE